MSTPYLVFIVEDNPIHAEALKRSVERLIPNIEVRIHARGFNHALDQLYSLRPDIFIIDLYEGEYSPETLIGPTLCEKIWNKRFRPLIVNSAFDADPHIDHQLAGHPFYKYIGKGSDDCAEQVASQVKEFLTHVATLREVEDEIHSVLQTVIRDTVDKIWTAQTDSKMRAHAIMRSARRRVGAMMDLKPILLDEKVYPWEQYIIPPLESDLLMGDLLRFNGSPPNDPTAYRTVLTPSCDLVCRNGKAKVSAITVGKCVSIEAFLIAARLKKDDSQITLKSKLETILTQPQINGYCPLPAYPDLWPHMAIKLRDTELLPFNKWQEQFTRIASIDSPFREQIAWAHMQIASRPALPDRDLGVWIESILSTVQ